MQVTLVHELEAWYDVNSAQEDAAHSSPSTPPAKGETPLHKAGLPVDQSVIATSPTPETTAPATAAVSDDAVGQKPHQPHHCVVHAEPCQPPVYSLALVAGRIVLASDRSPFVLQVPTSTAPPPAPAADNTICQACFEANHAALQTPVIDTMTPTPAPASASARRETMVLAAATPGLPKVVARRKAAESKPRAAPENTGHSDAPGGSSAPPISRIPLKQRHQRPMTVTKRQEAAREKAVARRQTARATAAATKRRDAEGRLPLLPAQQGGVGRRMTSQAQPRPMSPRFRAVLDPARRGLGSNLRTPSSPLVRRERGEQFEPGCLAHARLPPRRALETSEDPEFAARVEALLKQNTDPEELKRVCMQGSSRVLRSPPPATAPIRMAALG